MRYICLGRQQNHDLHLCPKSTSSQFAPRRFSTQTNAAVSCGSCSIGREFGGSFELLVATQVMVMFHIVSYNLVAGVTVSVCPKPRRMLCRPSQQNPVEVTYKHAGFQAVEALRRRFRFARAEVRTRQHSSRIWQDSPCDSDES